MLWVRRAPGWGPGGEEGAGQAPSSAPSSEPSLPACLPGRTHERERASPSGSGGKGPGGLDELILCEALGEEGIRKLQPGSESLGSQSVRGRGPIGVGSSCLLCTPSWGGQFEPCDACPGQAHVSSRTASAPASSQCSSVVSAQRSCGSS